MNNLTFACALLCSTLTTIAQCTFSFGHSFTANGGSGTIRIVGCTNAWTASSPVSWVTITPTSGSGASTLTYTCQTNTSSARSATLTIASLSFPVSQEAAALPPDTSTWVKSFGSSGSEAGRAITSDGSGNSYLAASFTTTCSFGGASFTSAGGYDVALAKYSPGGAHVWSKRFGGVAGENANSIALGSNGSIAVAGTFGGAAANLGGTNLPAGGNVDAFVALYSADGSHQWSRSFGSTGVDTVYSVAVDSQGNVVITGTFQRTVNFGGGSISSTNGATDLFIAKYSSNGTHVWSKSFPNNGDDVTKGIVLDNSNDIYVAGYFTSWINFGGGNLVSSDTVFGGPEAFIAKLTSSGSYVWAKRYGSNKTERFHALAMDSDGDLVVAGEFYPHTDLGGGTLTLSVGSTTYGDLFVAKYSGVDGAYRWAQRIGGSLYETVKGITSDHQGNVLVTGSFQGTCIFGSTSLVSAGSEDIFVAKYTTGGGLVWAKGFGGTGADGASSIAVDQSDYSALTGSFTGTCTFGSTNVVSSGSYDAFITRLSP